MENKYIIEGNKIISHSDFNIYEFAEPDRKPISDNFYLNILSYHKDWNMLMDVVEKISRLHQINDLYINYSKVTDALLMIDIEILFEAVVEFIKWYNSNK